MKLETGRIVTLTGKNGSGKSTLSHIAAGLLKPTAGSIEIKDIPAEYEGIQAGLVFQNPDEQLLNADVESEIAYGLENLNMPIDEMKARVNETLDIFNLKKFSQHSPDSLSDGWKQITAIAAVIAMKPMFLILDEVTAFLDPYWTERIKEIVKELSKQIGVLWITSSTRQVIWQDEILSLQNGLIIRQEA
ncbi:energy-coupling factor ABC transporter ATP-binding protein [bacterium]|nr:energy-coupling factor ABC transporter ATP-binding protein [bacterium]